MYDEPKANQYRIVGGTFPGLVSMYIMSFSGSSYFFLSCFFFTVPKSRILKLYEHRKFGVAEQNWSKSPAILKSGGVWHRFRLIFRIFLLNIAFSAILGFLKSLISSSAAAAAGVRGYPAEHHKILRDFLVKILIRTIRGSGWCVKI